ncbi:MULTISPECIES: pectinesterase family protein [Massilia]|uniref:pectinesterase family protein n=1 Tax=Massilia TaxID=149698 RepID=UPI000F2DD7DD|nr:MULTISPECIES: pectinesterase family protein [Massilia]MDY0961203.1 pectinesterase family protein [Massilia sp. CFBP9026]
MSAALAALTLALASAVSERQHAPSDGWAAQEGGTRGGAMAAPSHVYTVRTPDELLAALQAPAPARIVRVAASIDMSADQPFSDSADQARRGMVRVPANTTLLGVTPDAGFVNASLVVSGVSQVIVRNLQLRNPCDVDPKWDPQDGARGNWNSRYDGISVSNARHVWIDHNSFTDAPVTDDTQPVENGMPKQCHDGALDITNGSDFVSVTYNRFALHEKNTLVGGSDRAQGDREHLRVTFKGNLFEHVSERAPRVRYGQVHLLNNYHVGDRKHPVYAHAYSVGVGTEAHVITHANAYEILGATTCAQVVRAPGGSAGVHVDQGSALNGQPLTGCPHGGDVGWRVPYRFDALPAHEVPRHVLAHAGPRTIDRADGVVEARLVLKAGAAPFVLQARRDDQGGWQGASVRAIDDGATLQVELLEARGGAPVRLKQVRRRAPLPGTPMVLRVESQAGMLSAWLDGERVTSSQVAPLAASAPAAWEAAGHALLDLRDGPAGLPAERIALRIGANTLALQAGDPPERIAIVGQASVATSSDPGIASVSISNEGLLVTPHKPGHATIAVGGPDPSWQQTALMLEVAKPFAGPRRTTLPDARLRPAHAERGVPPDTPLLMTFQRPPVLSGAGSVRIVRRHDGAQLATIRPGETVIALGPAGKQRLLRHHAITVEGNAVRVRLPLKLDHGMEYEAVVDPALLRDPAFRGARWTFRTTSYPPVGDSVTVDDDGRADFRTVQGALDHAMTLPQAQAVTVNVRDGVYPELLYLRDKDKLMLRGQSREATIIRAANSDARNPGSEGRALFLAQGSDLLEIRDMTLHNTTRRSDGHSAQAETVFFSNDKGRFIARNAAFLSEQDTLQLTGYTWIYRSLVEGNVDFIWGNNRAALFEESEIRSVGDSASMQNGGYLVQARTVEREDPGFVFLRSRLTQGPGPVGNLPPPGSVYLARSPGTAHTWDNVTFIGNTVDRHIAADAWLRQPAPNPLVGDSMSGWRESGNTAPDGMPRSFGAYRMSEDEARDWSTRSRIFKRFNDGQGWEPGP